MGSNKKTGFDEYYNKIYGDRWPALRERLLTDSPALRLEAGLLKPYFLDSASAAAARALGVRNGDRVLDMCAAPGGKTLLLALALAGTGSLTSNDRSSDRRRRLKTVIDNHLPPGLRANITVTGHDAVKWGLYEQSVYDRILLDAPCSSEEHVLKAPSHLAKWTPARSKQLAVQAHAMLASAVTAAKPGGTIVYSTCALSPLENDGVIGKLLKKRSDLVSVDPPEVLASWLSEQSESVSTCELTEYGIHILPDKCCGSGPIYICRIHKN